MQDDQDVILELERRRCAAICAGDGDTLRSMLIDTYTHVHLTGALDTREGHIARVISHPRETEREALSVSVHGNGAVITGDQINHMQQPDGTVRLIRGTCLQLLVRCEGEWRFAATVLTPKR